MALTSSGRSSAAGAPSESVQTLFGRRVAIGRLVLYLWLVPGHHAA